MIFDVQTIFGYYSSPFLFSTAIWFATAGYLSNIAVLMILTRLPFSILYKALLKVHAISLIISYLLVPIIVVMGQVLLQLLYATSYQELSHLNIFVYFLLIMFWSSSYFLCSFFKQSSCHKFKQSLGIAHFLLMIGYPIIVLVQQQFSIVG